jgi:hypothetical protein
MAATNLVVAQVKLAKLCKLNDIVWDVLDLVVAEGEHSKVGDLHQLYGYGVEVVEGQINFH